jgi:hypothetical protein
LHCVLGLLVGIPVTMLVQRCRSCGRRLHSLASSLDQLCPGCRAILEL